MRLDDLAAPLLQAANNRTSAHAGMRKQRREALSAQDADLGLDRGWHCRCAHVRSRSAPRSYVDVSQLFRRLNSEPSSFVGLLFRNTSGPRVVFPREDIGDVHGFVVGPSARGSCGVRRFGRRWRPFGAPRRGGCNGRDAADQFSRFSGYIGKCHGPVVLGAWITVRPREVEDVSDSAQPIAFEASSTGSRGFR